MKAPLVLGLVVLTVLGPGCDRENEPEATATKEAKGEAEAWDSSWPRGFPTRCDWSVA